MKTILLSLMLIISTTTNVFAQNAILVEEGEPAPFHGTLVKNERIEKLVKAEKSYITLKQLSLSQDAIIDYYKDDARLQRKRLSEAKFNAFWTNTGYFALGVVLASFAFKVNQEIGEL